MRMDTLFPLARSNEWTPINTSLLQPAAIVHLYVNDIFNDLQLIRGGSSAWRVDESMRWEEECLLFCDKYTSESQLTVLAL